MLGSKNWQQGTLCIRKSRCDYVLSPLSSTMNAMNADLLAPGSNVFYLRGTTGGCVPATIVGLSSFLECVAISYEHSGRTQLYCDCPWSISPSRLSVRGLPLPNVVRPHRLPPPSALE